MSGLPPRALSGAVVSLIGRLLGTACSVVTVGVIARSIVAGGGVTAYGAYATILAFLSTLAVVADGGLYLVFTRRAAREDDAGEARLLGDVVLLRLLALVVAFCGLAVAVVFLPYPNVVRYGILLGSLGVGSQLLSQLLLGAFQKRLRMTPPAVAEVIGRVVTLLAAVLIAERGGSLLAFVGAFVLGALTTLLWNLAAARRALSPIAFPRAGSGPRLRRLTREAFPLGVLLLSSLVIFRADSLLLSLLRPPQDIAWYALPYKVLESLLFFPAMMGGLLFPALAREGVAGKEQAFRTTLADATSLFFLLALPLTALLFVASPVVIAILGGAPFGPSVGILRILSVALGALFFGNLYGNSALALGEQRRLVLAALTLAFLNLAVNLLVIPVYGGRGAALTTLGTEVLSAGAAAVIVFRRVHVPLFTHRNLSITCAGAALGCALLAPLPVGGRVVLGVAAYGATLSALGILTRAKIVALLRAQRLSS